MPFSVDPDTMQVAGRHRAVPFVMDWPGGGAVLSPDDDPCTVRRLGWGEKRALARFATAGAGFLERELVAICGSSGGPVSPDRHGAMLALTMWLDSPGGDALPFDATLLASASLKVAAATGLTLDALDARPACDVELLWRALETVPRGAAQSDLQPSAIDRPAHAADAFTHIVVLPDAHPSNVERSDSLVVPVRDAADARAPLEPVSSLPLRRGHSRDNRDAAAAVSRTAPSPKLPGTPQFRVLAPALPHADGEEKAAPDRSEPTPRRNPPCRRPAKPPPRRSTPSRCSAKPPLRACFLRLRAHAWFIHRCPITQPGMGPARCRGCRKMDRVQRHPLGCTRPAPAERRLCRPSCPQTSAWPSRFMRPSWVDRRTCGSTRVLAS